MKNDFKGIWIPKEICLIEGLNWTEKILLVQINSLDNGEGCFAKNEYFADFFGISKDRASRIINKLIKMNYLFSNIIYKTGTKQIEKRLLKLNQEKINITQDNNSLKNENTPVQNHLSPIGENNVYPLGENAKDNNIIINNNNIYVQNSENPSDKKDFEKNFERFYEVYPKKKKRAKVLSWFKSHNPSNELVDKMIEAVKKQTSTFDWQKDSGKYIPHPYSWLNSESWENEIDSSEIAHTSEGSISYLLATELFERVYNKESEVNNKIKKLVTSWAVVIDEYLSLERTPKREDKVFYAIDRSMKTNYWKDKIIDAKSLIKNIDFI